MLATFSNSYIHSSVCIAMTSFEHMIFILLVQLFHWEKEDVDFLYLSKEIHFFLFPMEMTVPIKGGMGKNSF